MCQTLKLRKQMSLSPLLRSSQSRRKKDSQGTKLHYNMTMLTNRGTDIGAGRR